MFYHILLSNYLLLFKFFLNKDHQYLIVYISCISDYYSFLWVKESIYGNCLFGAPKINKYSA